MKTDHRHSADERLALELAAGATVPAAAKAAGVSERTANRRRADPAFRRRETELRADMVTQALGRLANASAAAAAVVTRVMLEGEESETRLRAAKTLLELLIRVGEHTQLAERVADLELRQDYAKAAGGKTV